MIKRIIITLLIALSCPLIAASEFTYDVKSLGKIPVLYNGRVQALDSVARFTLLSIQEKHEMWYFMIEKLLHQNGCGQSFLMLKTLTQHQFLELIIMISRPNMG